MKTLKFQYPVYPLWINLTVRRGTKHAGLSGKVILEDADGLCPRQFGQITDVKVKRFKDITQEELNFEHDIECRTYEGLLKRMKELYNNFGEEEIVTLIFFE